MSVRSGRKSEGRKSEPRKSDSKKSAHDSALDDVGFLLGRAYFSYIGLIERILQDRKIEDLAPGMVQILFALFENDDCIIKDIADRVGLSQSTLTGMLTRMERNGLIDRRRDAIDGRAVRVRLTSSGKALEQKCWSMIMEMRDRFRKSLSENELDALRHGLTKFSAATRPAPAKRGDG